MLRPVLHTRRNTTDRPVKTKVTALLYASEAECRNKQRGKAYYYALQSEARRRVVEALNGKILRTSGALRHFDRLTLASILSHETPDALTDV